MEGRTEGRMKGKGRRAAWGTLAVAACAALHSCVLDDGPAAPAPDPQAMYVTFHVAAQGAAARRAPAADVRDDQILTGPDGSVALHAAFFDTADGACVGRVSAVRLLPSGDGRYSMQGLVVPSDPSLTAEELKAKDLRLMLWANVLGLGDAGWRGLLEGGLEPEDGIKGLTYDLPAQPDIKSIPMFGMCTPDLSGLRAGEPADVGGIDLVRAAAKVEVVLADSPDLAGVTLKGATLAGANARGYVMPVTPYSEDNLPRVPRDPAPSALSATAAADGKSTTLYLCEWMYDEAAPRPLAMTVAYEKDGEAGEGTIYFCPYADGRPDTSRPWDVRRNHLYRFTVRSVRNTTVRLDTQVEDWEEVREDPLTF